MKLSNREMSDYWCVNLTTWIDNSLTLKNNSGYLLENFFNSSDTGCKLLSIGMQMESTLVNKLRNSTYKVMQDEVLGNLVA